MSTVTSATKRSGFIVHPLYDIVFFIASPLYALAIGMAVSDTFFTNETVQFLGNEQPLIDLMIGSFIMAHLGLVLFRSHANVNIFNQYRFRFTVVPIALFVSMMMSSVVLVMVSVLATWWDVYHSSLQTFGIGRIYDRKAGNDPDVGRRLDIGLNLLMYAGPILAGATLMAHLEAFEEFSEIDWTLLASIPVHTDPYRETLTYLVVTVAAAYLIVYLAWYIRLWRQGYQVSLQKVALFIGTCVVSIYAWGFNSFGEAFFVMNFFHALQYFALVWWSEKGNLKRILRVPDGRGGSTMALLVFLAAATCYGTIAYLGDASNRPLFCVALTISIIHFWYDGFIWSVRKKQV